MAFALPHQLPVPTQPRIPPEKHDYVLNVVLFSHISESEYWIGLIISRPPPLEWKPDRYWTKCFYSELLYVAFGFSPSYLPPSGEHGERVYA